MKEITYVWHDAEKENPVEKGQYLVTTFSGDVTVAEYGKFKEDISFNCYDDEGDPFYGDDCQFTVGWYIVDHFPSYEVGMAMEAMRLNVSAWAEFPAPYDDKKEDMENTPVDFMEQADNILDASSIDFACTKDDAVRYVNDIFKNAQETGEEVPYDIIKLFL